MCKLFLLNLFGVAPVRLMPALAINFSKVLFVYFCNLTLGQKDLFITSLFFLLTRSTAWHPLVLADL